MIFSIIQNCNIGLSPYLSIECTYEKMGRLMEDRGNLIAEYSSAASEECGADCDSKSDCGSIVFCKEIFVTYTNCYLHKTKMLESEPFANLSHQADSPKCSSYYKKCSLGSYVALGSINSITDI